MPNCAQSSTSRQSCRWLTANRRAPAQHGPTCAPNDSGERGPFNQRLSGPACSTVPSWMSCANCGSSGGVAAKS
eukprot:10490517-Alexandrium_andersonii.AAC.1